MKEIHMARNLLENITYQHVIYGARTILSGRSNIRAALIQPEEFEAAIAHAKPLADAEIERSRGSSESSEYDLKRGESDLYQILDVYNATVIDGRFIDDLATDPKSVAAKLGIQLSDSAAAAMEEARVAVAGRFGYSVALRPSKIVAIAIVVVIAIRADEKPYEIVVDSSGLIKV
jgi:hypothetical protein